MAQRGVNKVILLGNVGKDPEIRQNNQGGAIANLTLATSESWKDKNTGQQQEKTEWHRVVVFGKLAEIAQQYVKKGSKIYVEGKLQTRKWTDQQGQDKYTTEVVVDGFNGVMQFLDSPAQQEGQQQQGGYQQPQHQQQQQQQQQFNQQAQQQGGYQQASQGRQQPTHTYQQPANNQQGQPMQQAPQGQGFDDFDDDIPF